MSIMKRQIVALALSLAVTAAFVGGCSSEPPAPTNPVTEEGTKEAQAVLQKEFAPSNPAKKKK